MVGFVASNSRFLGVVPLVLEQFCEDAVRSPERWGERYGLIQAMCSSVDQNVLYFYLETDKGFIQYAIVPESSVVQKQWAEGKSLNMSLFNRYVMPDYLVWAIMEFLTSPFSPGNGFGQKVSGTNGFLRMHGKHLGDGGFDVQRGIFNEVTIESLVTKIASTSNNYYQQDYDFYAKRNAIGTKAWFVVPDTIPDASSVPEKREKVELHKFQNGTFDCYCFLVDYDNMGIPWPDGYQEESQRVKGQAPIGFNNNILFYVRDNQLCQLDFLTCGESFQPFPQGAAFNKAMEKTALANEEMEEKHSIIADLILCIEKIVESKHGSIEVDDMTAIIYQGVLIQFLEKLGLKEPYELNPFPDDKRISENHSAIGFELLLNGKVSTFEEILDRI